MSQELRVLLVEDCEDDAFLLIRELRRNNLTPQLERVDNAQDLGVALERGSWDVVLVDYYMPRFSGPEALDIVKRLRPELPVIIVSATIGEEAAVASMKSGAYDYVMKGKMRRLVPALKRALREAEERNERRLAEESLRRAEERYRALFERSMDCIYIIDLEGRVLDFNDGALRLTGYSRRELTDLDFTKMMSEAYQDQAVKVMEEVLATGATNGSYEYAIRRKDGALVYVEAQASLIFRDGRPYAIQGVARDITDRKRAEEALREREERLRQITDNMLDLISVTDAAGSFIYLSPSNEKVLGYSASEMLGMSVFELVHPEDAARVALAAQDAIVHHRAGRQEFRFRHKDGHFLWVESVGNPLYDDQGEYIGSVFGSRDVTDRRNAEQALRDRMEQRLFSQKMVALGRLASGLAHDLNNLLGIITGYGDLIDSSLEPEHPSHDDLREIVTAARHTAQLTQRLLAFGSQQALAPQPSDLNQLVEDLSPFVRSLAGEAVRVEFELAPQLPVVTVDARSLSQALINIAMNAVDAMPQGGLLRISSATIAAASVPRLGDVVDADELVRLTVTDSGPGIDGDAGEIFEPFFTTREDDTRTGLGLSTAYGIVRQSGGTIDVESDSETGTAVHIYLPVEAALSVPAGQVPASEAIDAPQDSGPDQADDLALGPKRILVVEDNPAFRRLVTRILERDGLRVQGAASAEAAQQLCQDADPAIDLLITDVVLPGQSGPELAAELQRRFPALRVIFISGYTEEKVHEQGVDSSAAFIQKPFTAKALRAKLRAVLPPSPQGAEATSRAQAAAPPPPDQPRG